MIKQSIKAIGIINVNLYVPNWVIKWLCYVFCTIFDVGAGKHLIYNLLKEAWGYRHSTVKYVYANPTKQNIGLPN